VPENIKALQSSVIARLKIMARLDIAERRVPQDGRINLQFEGATIDVRVATVPTVEGESVSLRLLNQEKFNVAKLQMEPFVQKKIEALLHLPNGIILITGPTGSGKSTSLYSFLSEVNHPERRIVTVEDPVENKLTGVMQIAVKSEIGLTFATALRSILRADPNIVMIGEIRDLETAEIAIRASLTGHLVFSTLHTNDAMGGISRSGRHGRGTVPRFRRRARLPRPAPGAPAVPALQGAARDFRSGQARSRHSAGHSRPALCGRRLRPLPRDRVLRTSRDLRSGAAHAGHAGTRRPQRAGTQMREQAFRDGYVPCAPTAGTR
jgi:energy-coupling factor transporter ATP-binding protein EcfA2